MQILPMLEEQAIFDAFDFSQNVTDGQTLANGTPIGQLRIDTYTCPSDNNEALVEGYQSGFNAASNYAGSSGPIAVAQHQAPDNRISRVFRHHFPGDPASGDPDLGASRHQATRTA
jgi:hypothetical protein